MSQTLITYDLRKPVQNYTNLYAALTRLSAKRSLESVWVMRSTYDAETIANYLKQYIDANDRLLVTGMDGWTSFNSMTNLNQV